MKVFYIEQMKKENVFIWPKSFTIKMSKGQPNMGMKTDDLYSVLISSKVQYQAKLPSEQDLVWDAVDISAAGEVCQMSFGRYTQHTGYTAYCVHLLLHCCHSNIYVQNITWKGHSGTTKYRCWREYWILSMRLEIMGNV